MLKPTKRKAFNFLRSYFDVLNELDNDKDKLSFLLSIINKQFLDEDPKGLNFIVNLCYGSQRHAIESSVKGWKRVNNVDPMTDPMTNPTTNPTTDPTTNPKEEEEKEEVKEEEEVKVKEKVKNIQERKSDFFKVLSSYSVSYSVKMVNDFFDYWSEHGDKDKKMRFEKEKTWSLEARLKRWSDKDWNKKDAKPVDDGRHKTGLYNVI